MPSARARSAVEVPGLAVVTVDDLVVAVSGGTELPALVGAGGPQGLEFLRHLVDTARRNAEREGIVRLYAVLSAESVTDDHPAQAYFRDRYSGLRDFVAEALTEACALGDADAPRVRAAANAIIAVMDGLQVQWLLDPGAVDMAASTDLVVTSLLAELAPGRTVERLG